MKRYLSISITLFLFSAINASIYLLFGIVYGDTSLSSTFTLTYPLQFIASVLLSFFCIASNIRGNREKNTNCVQTGSLLAILFSLLIFGVLAIFVDKFIVFMNFDPAIYHNFALMSIGQLLFSFVISIVTENLYFNNKDRRANICKLCFILLNFLTIILTTIITKNQIIIIAVNLSSLFIYCLIWLCFQMKKFKFDFSFVKNFKLESFNIVDQILMFVIYLFGFSSAFNFGVEFILALNLINLITDPAWDALDAINKIAKIDISQSKFNYKKAVKHSTLITICYFISSIVLFFGLFQLYHVNLTIGLIYLTAELFSMLIYIVKANLQTYLQLEYSAYKTTAIHIFSKLVRTFITIFVISPYNVPIGVVSGILLGFILFCLVRIKHFKVDSTGNLIKKSQHTDVERQN